MDERLAQVLAPYWRQKGAVIPALHKAQEEIGYLSEETISEIANFLGVTKNEVYGVATFYAQFRFERRPEHVIKVYECPAFYLKGGQRVLKTIEQELGIQPGETTKDNKFRLERVPCFGECSLSPVMEVDNTFYGRMTPAKAIDVLVEYRYKKE